MNRRLFSPILTLLIPISMISMIGTACSVDGLTGKNDLPSTQVDPAKAKTPIGAYGLYIASLVYLRDAIGNGQTSYVLYTGLLTDELMESNMRTTTQPLPIAIRSMSPDGPSTGYEFYALYSALQRVRGQANQAQLLLRDYYPADENGPLMAHMLATKGYAELLLAEAFCSGIPLSTLDYEGDYTLKPGSTTEEVLTHAIAKFDSAVALSGDSLRIKYLAQVGKGRALLQRGDYAKAAQAVVDVPDGFQYNLSFNVTAGACGLWNCSISNRLVLWFGSYPLSDNEGGNGLPFLSEPDGRIPPTVLYNNDRIIPDLPQNHTIRLASGIEAQLIRAEAELAAEDPNWLIRLNALRTTCTDAATCPSPAPAGIGGVSGLAPLSDPGTPEARVDLLFRERAYWMYLTGHRQGDLRRLIRQYEREAFDVYPTGPYNQDFQYGADVTIPVPQDEQRLNPHYSGCTGRNA